MLATFLRSIRDTVRAICTPSPPAAPAPSQVLLDLPCGCLPSPVPSSSTLAELMNGMIVHPHATVVKPKDDHCTTVQPLRRLSLVDALYHRESVRLSMADEPNKHDNNRIRRLTLVDAANRRQSVLPSATNKYAPTVEPSLFTTDGVDLASFELKERSTKRQGRILRCDSSKIHELFPCGVDKINSINYKTEVIEERMKRKREHLLVQMDNFKTHYNLDPIVTHAARGVSKRYGFIMPRPDCGDKENVKLDPPAPTPTPVTVAGPKASFVTLKEECSEYLAMVNASQDDVDTFKISNVSSSSSPSRETFVEKVASSHCCSHAHIPSVAVGDKEKKQQGFPASVKESELGQSSAIGKTTKRFGFVGRPHDFDLDTLQTTTMLGLRTPSCVSSATQCRPYRLCFPCVYSPSSGLSPSSTRPLGFGALSALRPQTMKALQLPMQDRRA